MCPCPAPGSRGVLKLTLVVILYSDMFTLTLARPMETGPIVSLKEYERAGGCIVLDFVYSARVMGACVSAHLHQGLTHVLCELKEGIDHVVWPETLTLDCFDNAEQGRRL